jgi:hypothetical protein
MKHIWEYLQDNANKTVVIITINNDQAFKIVKNIIDQLERHTIFENRKHILFSRNHVQYHSNKVMVVSYEFLEQRIRGTSIDLFLCVDGLGTLRSWLAQKYGGANLVQGCEIGVYNDE